MIKGRDVKDLSGFLRALNGTIRDLEQIGSQYPDMPIDREYVRSVVRSRVREKAESWSSAWSADEQLFQVDGMADAVFSLLNRAVAHREGVKAIREKGSGK